MQPAVISSPYEQIHTFQARLRGAPISYKSKPGLPDWNLVKPSATLIAELAELPSQGKILVFGCGHGAGVAGLAAGKPGCEIWLTDASSIALAMSRLTLAENKIEETVFLEGIGFPEALTGQLEAVIIDLPKGRRLARRWLVQAWSALKPGGYLYLSGSNAEGIQSVILDAQALWQPGVVLGYRKGSRIVRFVKKPPHPTLPDWANEPGIRLNSWVELDLSLLNRTYHLYSLPGIFSYDRLDDGTRFLLENVSIRPGARLLDLGCGYGLIGLAACLGGAASADLLDVNLLAIAAARKNIAHYDLPATNILASDILQAVRGREYDQILTNPPFHAGKAVDYQMAQAFIEQSWGQLSPGGEFCLVANQFIRYDQLMAPRFKQVNLLAQNQSYKVWQAIK